MCKTVLNTKGNKALLLHCFKQCKSLLLCCFILFGSVWCGLAQKQLLGKDLTKTAPTPFSFYSGTELFIGSNSVLTIQANEIILKENVSGGGTLHVANVPLVTIKTKKELSVATIKISKITLSLHSTLNVKGALVLENALVQLNNFNLNTKNPIIFIKNSTLLFNGVGQWFFQQKLKQQPFQPTADQLAKVLSGMASTTKMEVASFGNPFIFSKPFSINSIQLKLKYPPPKVATLFFS